MSRTFEQLRKQWLCHSCQSKFTPIIRDFSCPTCGSSIATPLKEHLIIEHENIDLLVSQ